MIPNVIMFEPSGDLVFPNGDTRMWLNPIPAAAALADFYAEQGRAAVEIRYSDEYAGCTPTVMPPNMCHDDVVEWTSRWAYGLRMALRRLF